MDGSSDRGATEERDPASPARAIKAVDDLVDRVLPCASDLPLESLRTVAVDGRVALQCPDPGAAKHLLIHGDRRVGHAPVQRESRGARVRSSSGLPSGRTTEIRSRPTCP